MARLSDVSPDTLYRIATYLPTWSQLLNMAEHLDNLDPWLEKRDSSDLNSFALVNKKCRDAARTVLYDDLQVRVYSNEYAEYLIASPHLSTRIRDIAWIKEDCDNPEACDAEEETQILVKLLIETKKLERLSIYHSHNFQVAQTAEITTSQLQLPQLRSFYASSQVTPHSLLQYFANLESLVLRRQFTHDEAKNIVAGLSQKITTLILGVKKISLSLLKDLVRLKRLEVLAVETALPHENPWGEVDPTLLGAHLAEILRPLQQLRELLLGIAPGQVVNLDGGYGTQDENILVYSSAAEPIARALPRLGKISWMSIGDSSSLYDHSDSDQSEYDGEDEGVSKYWGSDKITGEVVREDGQVTVQFEY